MGIKRSRKWAALALAVTLCTGMFTAADVFGAEAEITKPVLQEKPGTSGVTVSFQLDAAGLAGDGYEVMAALYKEGRLVDVSIKTTALQKGEMSIFFMKPKPFDVCKLFVMKDGGWEPAAVSVEIAGGKVVTPIADQYGVALGIADGSELDQPIIKLLLSDGSTRVFETVSFKAGDRESELFYKKDNRLCWEREKIPAGSIIRFGCNDKGRINIIEGVAGINSDLKLITTGKLTDNVTMDGIWNGKPLNEEAAVFSVDAAVVNSELPTAQDCYANVYRNELLGADNVTAYAYLEKHGEIVAMLVKEDFLLQGERYGIIKSTVDNGDTKRITAYINRAEVEFDAAAALCPDFSESTTGGLYQFSFENGTCQSILCFEEVTDGNDMLGSLSTGRLQGPGTLSEGFFEYGSGNRAAVSDELSVYSERNGRWRLNFRNALQELRAGDEVIFYDTVGGDGIYDIALIHEFSEIKYGIILKTADPDPRPLDDEGKFKLLLADESVKIYYVKKFSPDKPEYVLFLQEDGKLRWNPEFISPGTTLRFRENECGVIDTIEGVANIGEGLQSIASPEGITAELSPEGVWNGYRITDQTIIYTINGDRTDEKFYRRLSWEELLQRKELTVYSAMAADGALLALTAAD